MNLKQLQNGSDVRGVLLWERKANLTGEAVYKIAKAFAAWLPERLKKEEPDDRGRNGFKAHRDLRIRLQNASALFPIRAQT